MLSNNNIKDVITISFNLCPLALVTETKAKSIEICDH